MRSKNKELKVVQRISILLAICVMAGIVGHREFQAKAAENTVNVVMTISNAGKLVLSGESVSVSDVDQDGVISLSDALYCAHELRYKGGAEAGYRSETTDFGLSLVRLWGMENGGSYGYYLNHKSAYNLLDAVKEGDYISAYTYADLTGWSDIYVYFNSDKIDLNQANEYTLTLNGVGLDENWMPIVLPIEGAKITFDGKVSDFVTDAEGKVTLTGIPKGVISAVSDRQVLVPPVCIAVKDFDWSLPIIIFLSIVVYGVLSVVTIMLKKARKMKGV